MPRVFLTPESLSMAERESLWLCAVIFLAAEMCCTKLRLRRKTADVGLWQSFLPQSATTKQRRENVTRTSSLTAPCEWIITPLWLRAGRRRYRSSSNPLTLKPFQPGSPALRQVIRRWHWAGCDTLRSFKNKKIFLVEKRSGKWNDSPRWLSTRSSSKRWDGDTGGGGGRAVAS